MLKVIVSKNESSIYKEISRLKKQLKFDSKVLDIEIDNSVALSKEVSIFGDKEIFLIKDFLESDYRYLDNIFFKKLSDSEHLFLLVGSGVEFEKIFKEAKHDVIKLEEKFVNDFPADLVAAIQKNDRKNSWNFMVRELRRKDAEPVHGSCIFAYKSLLTYLLDPVKNSPNSGVKDFSWKQAGSNSKNAVKKRELQEVSDKYFDLVLKYHLARSGLGLG